MGDVQKIALAAANIYGIIQGVAYIDINEIYFDF